jgi:uncharacterized glyoxalase superfamily protein PhnB
MVNNRSVPTDTVLPHITYRDVARASAWLTAAFGFTEHYRYGPPGIPSGAQLYLRDAWIMLKAADPGEKTPAELGYGTSPSPCSSRTSTPTSSGRSRLAP